MTEKSVASFATCLWLLCSVSVIPAKKTVNARIKSINRS